MTTWRDLESDWIESAIRVEHISSSSAVCALRLSRNAPLARTLRGFLTTGIVWRDGRCHPAGGARRARWFAPMEPGGGGGQQVLFRDSSNQLVSVEELTGLGLLEEVRERV